MYVSPTSEVVDMEMPWPCEASSSVITEELAAHEHGASCSTSGNHFHLEINNSNVAFNNATTNLTSGEYIAAQTSSSRGEAYALLKTSNYANVGKSSDAGNHNHYVNTNKTGNNQPHENRMPYTVINRWKRTT